MKRAALCFYGQLRNVQNVYDLYIKPNLLTPNLINYDIDVFMHTWFSKYDMGYIYKGSHFAKSASAIESSIFSTIYNSYNPVRLLFEEQMFFDVKNYHTNKFGPAITAFVLSKIYSTYQSIKLKEEYEKRNNFIYDVVISTRTDLGFLAPVDIDMVDKPGIWHPDEPGWHLPEYPPDKIITEIINDPYVMGDSKSMDTYGNLFFEIDQLFNSGCIFFGEMLAYRHLVNNNIPITKFFSSTGNLNERTYSFFRT